MMETMHRVYLMIVCIKNTNVALPLILLLLVQSDAFSSRSTTSVPVNGAVNGAVNDGRFPLRASRTALRSSYSATDLLYQDQQGALARRAAIEEELLGRNSKPLKSPKAKKVPVKRGSGFGAGKQDNRTPAQRYAEQQAKVVKKDGVLRIDNALSEELCDRLRIHVLRQEELAAEETAKDVSVSTEYYGVENRRKNRCDLLLSLIPADDDTGGDDRNIIPDVLQQILGAGGTLRSLYETLVTNEGEFYEFATVITHPGSDRQQVHPDLPHRQEAPLYVIFLALQDVTTEMGPTTFLLGTHTSEERAKFDDHGRKDEQLKTANSRLALLNKGDAVLFDARTLHCGNANEEEGGATRAMFNFSFRNPKEVGSLGYCGSMRPGYVGRLTLGDIGDILADYSPGDQNDMLFERYGNGLVNA